MPNSCPCSRILPQPILDQPVHGPVWKGPVSASFLIVGAISLLAIFPAARLPGYVPGELSAEDIVSEARPGSGVASGL